MASGHCFEVRRGGKFSPLCGRRAYDRRITLRLSLAAAAALALLASPAAAKQKPVTGSAPHGYTVIAVDDRGRIGEAGGPKFRLIPTAGRFTLQLRDTKGNYAGPIVAPGTKRSLWSRRDHGPLLIRK